MALVVGVDSYVTLEEAEKIISDYIVDVNLLSKWNAIEDSNTKEVLLRTSCRDIDHIRFKGKKLTNSQRLQFPRGSSHITGYGCRLFIGQFGDNGLVESGSGSNGLEEVKQAQVENAVWHASIGELTNEQVGVNIRGLTSKKAGPISESYSGNTEVGKSAINGIYTPKVYAILTDWISSSFGVT